MSLRTTIGTNDGLRPSLRLLFFPQSLCYYLDQIVYLLHKLTQTHAQHEEDEVGVTRPGGLGSRAGLHRHVRLLWTPEAEPDMIKLIHHAIDAGVILLDTADVYGPFTNKLLLGKALSEGVRDKVELATKFGISFEDNQMEIRGEPSYVSAACEGSLKRFGVDSIDLYYQHRIDTRVDPH